MSWKITLKTFLRPFQDVVLGRLQDVLQKQLEEIFKKCSICFGNVFKMPSIHFAKMPSRGFECILSS